MENWEFEKDVALRFWDTVSNASVGIGHSSTRQEDRKTSSRSRPSEAREIDEEVKERPSHHRPHRLGIVEWKIGDGNSKEHLKDTVVYEDLIDENIGQSIYEITQERDQTLTEKACCSSDVIRIWNQISHYVKRKLREGCGVIIPGLCTFTLAVTKNSLETQERFELRLKPILVLSKVLTSRYKLVDTSERIPGFRPPATLINLSDVGVKAKVSRSIVEGVVTEVLQTFARALVCKKSIEFPFPFIGKLQVRNQEARMKFYGEFYKNMGFDLDSVLCSQGLDGSGSVDWNQDVFDQDSGILCGRITPLNIHIPTDTFRSVFHLREVRSVSHIIAITEEDLRHLGCFDVECLPREEHEVVDDPTFEFPSEKCEPRPEFIWCPPGEALVKIPYCRPEDEVEEALIDYYAKWAEQVRISKKFPHERHGEFLGENDDQDALRKSQEKLPRETQEGVPQFTPFDLELGLPCRHNFLPEPLYVERPSGNPTMDMILPDKTHFTNILFQHHYHLCTKMLGIEQVKQHFTNKVTTTSSFNNRTSFDDI